MAWAATACADDGSDPITTAGELGNGRFTYVCIHGRDALCEQTQEDTFPSGIAVGGQFVLEYESDEPGLSATVVSAIPEILSKDSDVFLVRQAGFAAALAKLPTGEIVDIKHVRGRDIDRLELHRSGASPTDQVEIEVGGLVQVWAVPLDNLGRVLAGALEYTWVADDENVVEVDANSGDERATLRGVSEGVTQVHVSAGNAVASLEVTVTGDPGGTDSGDSDSDGSDSSDTGPGSDDTGTDDSTGTSDSDSDGDSDSSDSGGTGDDNDSGSSGSDDSGDDSDSGDSGSTDTDTDTTTNNEMGGELR